MTLLATTLDHKRVRLELTSLDHLEGLKSACADGALNKLWYTVIPTPDVM